MPTSALGLDNRAVEIIQPVPLITFRGNVGIAPYGHNCSGCS